MLPMYSPAKWPLLRRRGAPLALVRASAEAVVRVLNRSATLVRNSGALAIGTVASAVLGFAYWWLAARMFPPGVIGTASAILSAMALIGRLGDAGLGTLLTSELARHRGRVEGLVSGACLVGMTLSLLLGLLFVLLTSTLGVAGELIENGVVLAAFLAGCALIGLCYVGDGALVGMLRGTSEMIRMILFSVLKLVFLVGALHHADESTLLLTWVAALLASWIGLELLTPGLVRSIVTLPDLRLLASLRGKALAHYWLDLTLQAPNLGMPYLVLALLSPSLNAAFTTLWMVVLTMGALPGALSTILLPVMRADSPQATHHLNLSLAFSLAVSLACAVGLFLFSQSILGVFNPTYPDIAGSDLRFLGFSLIGLSLKVHACTLMRLADSMAQAARWFAVGLGFEVVLSALGARLDGLQGLVLGYTLAVSSVGILSYTRSIAVAKRRSSIQPSGSSLAAVPI